VFTNVRLTDEYHTGLILSFSAKGIAENDKNVYW